MSDKPTSQLDEEKKKLLRRVLGFTGYVFAAFGIASLIFPAVPADFLFGGDTDIAYMFGGALILVGISDIVIANTIFREKR